MDSPAQPDIVDKTPSPPTKKSIFDVIRNTKFWVVLFVALVIFLLVVVFVVFIIKEFFIKKKDPEPAKQQAKKKAPPKKSATQPAQPQPSAPAAPPVVPASVLPEVPTKKEEIEAAYVEKPVSVKVETSATEEKMSESSDDSETVESPKVEEVV